ncbi:MAG TPA: acyl-CoA thioesterase [Candidatus Polarisedimenticolaceae bacterium]|nr:acyl-CoA thioesterase [Candidatus Polarisedimenticolaceae bacterium]
MTEIVLPEDTNSRGYVFGGRVLSLIDKCAAIVAMRHARSDVTTASMDSVDFSNVVRMGEIIVLNGRINSAFTTSMEIEVEVHAEDRLTGKRTPTTRALVTMVALDGDAKPHRVPALESVTDGERRRAAEAQERRRTRLSRRG